VMELLSLSLPHPCGSSWRLMPRPVASAGALAFANSSDAKYDSPYALESTKEQQRMMEAQKQKMKALPGPLGGMLGKVAGAAMSQVRERADALSPLLAPSTSLTHHASAWLMPAPATRCKPPSAWWF
jgi:hypothetical protein